MTDEDTLDPQTEEKTPIGVYGADFEVEAALLGDSLAFVVRHFYPALWRQYSRIPGPARRERLQQVTRLVLRYAAKKMSEGAPPSRSS